MRRVFEAMVTVMVVAMVLLLLAAVTGCAFNVAVAGGRALGDAPLAKSPKTLDSLGTQNLHDTENAGGSGQQTTDDATASADKGTKAPSGLQTMQIGGDAGNSRSTDTGMASDASTAATRETSGTISPTQTTTDTTDITAGGTVLKGEVNGSADAEKPEAPLQTE